MSIALAPRTRSQTDVTSRPTRRRSATSGTSARVSISAKRACSACRAALIRAYSAAWAEISASDSFFASPFSSRSMPNEPEMISADFPFVAALRIAALPAWRRAAHDPKGLYQEPFLPISTNYSKRLSRPTRLAYGPADRTRRLVGVADNSKSPTSRDSRKPPPRTSPCAHTPVISCPSSTA